MYKLLLAVTIAAPVACAAAPDGVTVFRTRCAFCHGAKANGGERGPGIRAKVASRSDGEMADLITNGLPGAGMPGIRLSGDERTALIAYLRTLLPRDGAGKRMEVNGIAGVVRNQSAYELQLEGVDGKLHLFRKAGEGWREAKPGRDWPTYNGDVGGNRFSPLDQIGPGNVKGLQLAWVFDLPGAQHLEGTPVVADGVMYVTNANEVHALDPGTGREIWQYKRALTKALAGDAAGGINRGVAVSGQRLFLVTDNAHLLALNRWNGALLWDVKMADSQQNYGATSAPLVIGDVVVSGTSGGDEGVRGFLAGYKIENGERLWRFWTIPAPGEPLASTWKGKALEHGCGTTWLTGTYDPGLDLLYWPVGNPCPDYNGDERMGDNLYTDSVVALRPKTGELKWYFQYTPHDLHDWDAEQTPMLVDTEWEGQPRKLILHANRNGFFYVLDRTTGKFLRASPFVQKLTWAKTIGRDGRPVMNPEAIPTTAGVRACPAVEGATNWFSNAFDASQGLFFLQTLEKCNMFTKAEGVWKAGESYYNGDTQDIDTEPGQKVLRAIEVRTGKIAWELPETGPAASWGGVLATGSGLIFVCEDDGYFVAVDSRAGKRLWRFPANVLWKASPMTYSFDGKQYVAVEAGGNVLAFALPD